MARFRKKPIEVEAWQFTGDESVHGVCVDSHLGSIYPDPHVHTTHRGQIIYLRVGDWIIPEPDGEHFYPVEPTIFAETYEAVA